MFDRGHELARTRLIKDDCVRFNQAPADRLALCPIAHRGLIQCECFALVGNDCNVRGPHSQWPPDVDSSHPLRANSDIRRRVDSPSWQFEDDPEIWRSPTFGGTRRSLGLRRKPVLLLMETGF
jgi:hypothetical protein